MTEWGDRNAPPLVCAHGITAHSLRFRNLAARLHGRRVVALDLRGHGYSDWEPPWNLETHVRDLLDTADALGIGRADWIGHSFGGRLVLELASRAPERVDRLVLLDPAIWVPPPIALDRAEEARADESFASAAEAVATRMASDRIADRHRPLVEEELPDHLRLCDDGRWRFRYSRAAVVAAFGEMSKPPPLDEVRAPALLVRGAATDVLPDVLVQAVRDTYAGPLELVDVPGGHIVMWEALDETTDAIVRFLGL